ncbi:MAG: PulJ/GspJ family protein [Sporichthyaceae bacterium]
MRPSVCLPAGRRRSRDGGFTLVEVMVGISILTVLGGLLAGFVLDMIRTSAGTSARLSNVDQLRVAMDSLSKQVRTAVRPEQVNPACTANCTSAFRAASATALSFYANGGPGKVRLTTFRLEEDLPVRPGTARLVEERHPATPAGGTPSLVCDAGCTARTLARGLSWPVPAAEPVFAAAGADCATFSATVALAEIACVWVDLPVGGARDNPGTSVTSTIFLPNSAMGR